MEYSCSYIACPNQENEIVPEPKFRCTQCKRFAYCDKECARCDHDAHQNVCSRDEPVNCVTVDPDRTLDLKNAVVKYCMDQLLLTCESIKTLGSERCCLLIELGNTIAHYRVVDVKQELKEDDRPEMICCWGGWRPAPAIQVIIVRHYYIARRREYAHFKIDLERFVAFIESLN